MRAGQTGCLHHARTQRLPHERPCRAESCTPAPTRCAWQGLARPHLLLCLAAHARHRLTARVRPRLDAHERLQHCASSLASSLQPLHVTITVCMTVSAACLTAGHAQADNGPVVCIAHDLAHTTAARKKSRYAPVMCESESGYCRPRTTAAEWRGGALCSAEAAAAADAAALDELPCAHMCARRAAGSNPKCCCSEPDVKPGA